MVVNSNLRTIHSTRISRSNKSRTNMLDSNILKINLWALSKMNRKGIIIKFVIVCNLPRETPLSSKDRLLLDSNTFNKFNNQVLNKLSDSHYLKLTQLFTTQRRCNKSKAAIPQPWELMNSMFLEKQFWWLKILLAHSNLCSNLAQSNNLLNNKLPHQCIKMLEI